LFNVVAGRVANRLGLGGLNCTVDAACASSLGAMRVAIAELVDGRADMMITGGVDTENSIFMYMCFTAVGALSRTDQIKPLSDAANGTMLGEGLGMVALKRLADAERDGNRIYAVIKGIGSSSDGRAKSIYAPAAGGQRIALERAYTDAECSPASVELFEMHGTGTKVGDRTELTALGELLRDAGEERHVAALGTVKSQIGHTKGTAATAAVMKLAFALHQKVLPGTINVAEPNSAIDFDDAPFYINTRTRPWILDPARPVRRAAASTMGFGGTNFHVVLEEHTSDRTGLRMAHRTPMAYVWHAPDPAALLALLRSDAPGADGGQIPAEHARIGFVAVDDEQAAALRAAAVERLSAAADVEESSAPEGVFYRRRALANLRVGALFAGAGGQYPNMGLAAALNNPVVGRAFDTANHAFADAEVRLSRAVFPPPAFDADLRARQESDLARAELALPAIGALSVGQFGYLAELGLTCSAHSGHGFGQLTALWAAGSLSESDYFGLARAAGTAEAFAPAVGRVSVGAPNTPVYTNSSGASYGPDTDANAATLIRRLHEPVEFVDVLTEMWADGITVFLEFGPRQILTERVRDALGDEVYAIATDAGPDADSDVVLKRAAVHLAVLGVPLAGINRHTEPAVGKAAAAGMSVTLSATEYVPEQRRAAYRAALDDVPAPAAQPATAARSFGPRPGPARSGTRPTPGRAPAPAFTTRRDIQALAQDPVLRAHQIGAHIVLPATFGLGWLINAAEQAYPDMSVVEVADFQVYKGIVFNGTPHGDYIAQVETGTRHEDRIVVRANVRGETDTGRPIPHYSATLTLANEPAEQPALPVPPVNHGPDDTAEIYRQATLFHGPELQGIRKVLDRSPGHLTLQCKLPDTPVAEHSYHGKLHSPVLADVLLQATAILGKDLTGVAGMPLGIGRVEWFAPMPDDQPFIVRIDEPREGPATVTITATAVTTDGQVLQRFADVLLVSTKGVRVG
jgi:acyl transferase domain-containing protein